MESFRLSGTLSRPIRRGVFSKSGSRGCKRASPRPSKCLERGGARPISMRRSGVSGEGVLGALMPSIDGVGRYFPLTIFVGEGSGTLPPPEIETNNDWFDAVETILLDALNPESDFDTIAAAVVELPEPAQTGVESSLAGMTQLAGGA